jgi:Tfp pilus assembly protein PilV
MSDSCANQSGATLLEVVVASFLLSVSVMGLRSLYGQSAYVLRQAQQVQAAVFLSADFWELTQSFAGPRHQLDLTAVEFCDPASTWQQSDAFMHWQHRWRCVLPQASITVHVNAHQYGLAWHGLYPRAAVDVVLGTHP